MTLNEMNVREKNSKLKKTARVLFNSDTHIEDLSNEKSTMPSDSSGMKVQI